jgi:hypothetical protein
MLRAAELDPDAFLPDAEYTQAWRASQSETPESVVLNPPTRLYLPIQFHLPDMSRYRTNAFAGFYLSGNGVYRELSLSYACGLRRYLVHRALAAAALTLLVVIQSSSLPQISEQSGKPLTLDQVWALDRTYSDDQHGVSFRYPSTWVANAAFGYQPPALTLLSSPPVARFGYREGGFPRGPIVGPYAETNLEGVGFTYSIVPVTNAAKCEAVAASLSDSPKHTRAAFAHRSFSEYRTGQGGMSQYIEGKLYAAYVRPNCYLFETDVATASPAALDNIPALTPTQSRDIDAYLLNIMKTVRLQSLPLVR